MRSRWNRRPFRFCELSQKEVYAALKRLGGEGSIKQIRNEMPADVAATCQVSDRLMKLRKWGLVERVRPGFYRIVKT